MSAQAPPDPKRTPVENLEAVLAALMREWARYTFSSPPFKKTLADFVARHLPEVQLTPK